MRQIKGRLTKLKFTRWVLSDPTDTKKTVYVKAGTPGAVKVTEESGTYFIVWKEAGRQKKVTTGQTEYRNAAKFFTDWSNARDRGEVGLVDPHKTHLDRALSEHVAEYLASLSERSDQYQREVKRVLAKIEKLEGVSSLRDLTKDKIESYLASMKAGAVTRGMHRTYVRSFFTWLGKKVPSNPVDEIAVPKRSDRKNEKQRRRRRPYTVAELRKLMHAAVSYPLATRGRTQGGRPRRDGTPAQPRTAPAKLSQETIEKLTLAGQERQLVYRLHIATGLRRGELSRVTVGMLDSSRSQLKLPVTILKVQPEELDHYLIPLPPTLAAELRAFVALKQKKSEDKLVHVPLRRNYIREHVKRLKHAGIEYKTEKGFADIHAFRKTVNVWLQRRKNGVSLKQCQRYLRHLPPDITSKRYDHRDELTMGNRVRKLLARLDQIITTPPTTEGTATPS